MIAVASASSDKELLITFFTAYFALGSVFGTLAAMGWTAFFLAAHDDPETVKLSALWHPHPYWKYLGLGLLLLLIMLTGFLVAFLLVEGVSLLLGLLGMVLSFVAAVIFALMFMFAPLIVIDRELGPVDALKESYRVTRGHKWRLFLLFLIVGLPGPLWQAFDKLLGDPIPIKLLGALAIFAVLLVLMPIAALALTHVYRVLSGTNAAPLEPAADAKAAA